MRRLLFAFALASILAAVPVASSTGAPGSGPRAESAAPRTLIACLNSTGTRYIRRYRPSGCVHYGAGGRFSGGVDLRRIHWTSYNGRIARGRATECGESCAGPRVSVKAYRRVRACGRRVYTRLKASSNFGPPVVVRLRRCPGRV